MLKFLTVDLSQPTDNLHFTTNRGGVISAWHFAKFFLALFVVLQHCPVENELIHHLFLPVIVTAVPAFFIITGYFLVNNSGGITLDRLAATLKKGVMLYFWTVGFYVVFHIVIDFLQGGMQNVLQWNWFPKWDWPFIFLMSIIQECWHIWYLQAMITGFAILYLMKRFGLFKYLPLLAVVGTLCFIAYSIYGYIHLSGERRIIYAANPIMKSIPYITLGIVLRRYQHKVEAIDRKKLIGTLLLIWVIVYAAYLTLTFCSSNGTAGLLYSLYILGGIAAIWLTLALIAGKSLGRRANAIANLGRKHSQDIYIYHVMVILLTGAFLGTRLPGYFNYHGLIVFGLTFLFSFIFFPLLSPDRISGLFAKIRHRSSNARRNNDKT